MAGMYETTQRSSGMVIQEIGDAIFIAESTQNPVSRLLKRGRKPVQMLSEWPAQVYPDRAFEGTLDGTDISTFNHTERDKLSGYGMLLRTAGWMSTKLANLTQTAGVKQEKAKQMADDGILLARMIERQILSNDDTRAESGGDAYRSRGMHLWLDDGAQGVLPVPASYRPATACLYESTLNAYKPSDVEVQLNAMATAKLAPVDLLLIAGLKLKARMSKWAQHDTDVSGETLAQTWNLNASEKAFMQIVDSFTFDAGRFKSILSFHQLCTAATGAATTSTPRSGLFVDLDMWELNFLQAPTHYELQDEGGGPRGFHDAVYILKCLNPLGQGRVNVSADS